MIAGTYGGRRLQAPPGTDTRPTADRVREALFSILGDRVLDARVLDLFAGSGALGIEALSRGAAEATFVDKAAPAIRPGYHLNKRHWNTITLDGSLADQMVRDLIEDSYDLVVSALPKRVRDRLGWAPEAGAADAP